MERMKTRLLLVAIYSLVTIGAIIFLNVCSFIASACFACLFSTFLPYYPRVFRYLFSEKTYETYLVQMAELKRRPFYLVKVVMINLIFLAVTIVSIVEVPYSLLELIRR